MFKFASLVISATIGVAAVAHSAPAAAGPFVGIGIAVPVAPVVAAPVVTYTEPYFPYVQADYYYPEYIRYGYGHRFGYRYGYGYGHRYGYRTGFGYDHGHGGFRGHR